MQTTFKQLDVWEEENERGMGLSTNEVARLIKWCRYYAAKCRLQSSEEDDFSGLAAAGIVAQDQLTAEVARLKAELEPLREVFRAADEYMAHSGSFVTSYGMEIHGTGKLHLLNALDLKIGAARAAMAVPSPAPPSERSE